MWHHTASSQKFRSRINKGCKNLYASNDWVLGSKSCKCVLTSNEEHLPLLTSYLHSSESRTVVSIAAQNVWRWNWELPTLALCFITWCSKKIFLESPALVHGHWSDYTSFESLNFGLWQRRRENLSSIRTALIDLSNAYLWKSINMRRPVAAALKKATLTCCSLSE